MKICTRIIAQKWFSALLLLWVPFLLSAQLQVQNADYQYVEVLQNTQFHYSIPNGLATALRHPEHGTLSFNSSPPQIVYTPDNGFNGVDSVVVEIYNSWPLSINYVALELHVKPSIVRSVPDYVVGPVNTPIANIDVLSNDSTSLSTLKISRLALLNDGTATLNADSSLINFTPAPGFIGLAGLMYTACDDAGTCDQGMLIIRVRENTVGNQSFNLTLGENEALPLVLPDLGYEIEEEPHHGTLTQQVDPVFVYTPNDDFHGLDSFTCIGANGASASYHVDVLNKPVPNRFARPDAAYISTTTDSVIIDITDNDFRQWNINFNNLSLTQQPQFGTATLDNSTGLVTYTPNNGFEGIDVFEYELFFPIPWTKEKAKVYVVVSDQQPLHYTFELSGPMNTPRVLTYGANFPNYSFDIDVEPSYGSLEYFSGDTTIILQGQEVSGRNMLVYTPLEDYTSNGTPDEFELSYCVDGTNCVSVKVKMSVEDSGQNPVCIGSDCLWPGDANADGHVNMADVMALGLAVGETGPARVDASSLWHGQTPANWAYNGIPFDLSYVDCNGDGAITQADAAVISQHYLKTNTVVPNIPAVGKQNATLQILTPPPYHAGDLLEVAVLYGTDQDPVYDGYGLSFSFVYNPDLIVDSSVQVTFPEDSWLAYSSPVVTASEKPGEGRLDFAVSRANGMTVTGKGQVAQLSFIIEEDLQGIRSGNDLMLRFGLSNGLAMNGWGETTALAESSLDIPLDFSNESEGSSNLPPNVVAFPNPATDHVTLHLNDSGRILEVRLFSASGQQLDYQTDLNHEQITLQVHSLNPGIYIARVTTTSGTVSKKIQILGRSR